MIKFNNGNKTPAKMFAFTREHKNSDYKILVFEWWDWLWSQPGWGPMLKVQVLNRKKSSERRILQANLSTDEIIAEVKEHDICFFIIREIIDDRCNNIKAGVIENMMTELNKLNVFFITLSEDSQYPTDTSKTFNVPWFAESDLYTSNDTTIDFDYRPKDFTFNMLLGSKRRHRTKMFETLDESYIYQTYFGHKEYSLKSAGHLEDGDVWNNLTNQDLSRKLNTLEQTLRGDTLYSISHITPESIYNNSHFDIIAESQPLIDSLNFTTEKTGKPLSTRRFFIWYNSPHKVEYLKKFGFELQDYLCEYDNILDNDKRLEAIFELIKEIGDNENYIKKIYEDTKDARIHNQEVFKKLSKTTESNIASWITEQIDRNWR